MKLKYCGPARDYSGYGEANRHDLAALVTAGIEVTAEIPSYCLEIADFGRLGEIINPLENRKIGYKVIILHTTPNVYRKYMESGCYHIARVFWETDKLPLDFSINIQLCDEVWTGSKFNADAIRAAGVTKPIYIIPEAIDTDIDEINPYIIPNTQDYKFYSMFEWTERKNPTVLLSAFWQEFEKDEGVSLTIKTYVDNFTPDKQDEIKSQIKRLKKLFNLNRYASVYIHNMLMDRKQVYRFHQSFDCFVLPHRGEGWGIPQMEALLLGKPVISTNCGGIHEYLTHNENALLLDYEMEKVNNSRNKEWYTPDQKWAKVSIGQLRQFMRQVYTNQTEAAEMGKKGKEIVDKLFSLKAVGLQMRERLIQIQKSLEPVI